jgi:ATP-dependent DNA helicase RecQ
MRKQKAAERGIAPFVVFHDTTLREMARRRPTSAEQFLQVPGIGQKKAADYGPDFVQAIAEYCRTQGVPSDVSSEDQSGEQIAAALADTSVSGVKRRAFNLFEQGKSIEEVMQAVGRARSTTTQYLAEFIAAHGVSDASPWVAEEQSRRIVAAAKQVGGTRLTPIFEALAGQVPYDTIRLALACHRNAPPDA